MSTQVTRPLRRIHPMVQGVAVGLVSVPVLYAFGASGVAIVVLAVAVSVLTTRVARRREIARTADERRLRAARVAKLERELFGEDTG